MSTHDNAYSRFVAWAKVILPLMALGLLSTLFLFSRGIDTGETLPFTDIELEERARDSRITAPTFAGVTDDGTAITVAAEIARPSQNARDVLDATDLHAEIETPDHLMLDVTSVGGRMNGRAGDVFLHGGVEIQTSTGYRITSETFRANIPRSTVLAEGSIAVTGPLGSFRADEVSLRPGSDPGAGYLLVFKGGVKLIYLPQH